MEYKYLILLVPIPFFILLIWVAFRVSNQTQKDWQTLEDLQKRIALIETKDELDEFEIEFYDKGSKIFNRFITPHLLEIKGNINGMRKALK